MACGALATTAFSGLALLWDAASGAALGAAAGGATLAVIPADTLEGAGKDCAGITGCGGIDFASSPDRAGATGFPVFDST